MKDITGKATSLLAKVDWTRPELSEVAAAPDRAAALLAHLECLPRPRHLVETERKAEVVGYLDAHYPSWRAQDLAAAERLAAMPLERVGDARCTTAMPSLGHAWWASGDESHARVFQRFFLETATGGMFNWGSFISCQASIDLNAYLFLRDCPALTTEGKIAFFDHLLAVCDEAWDANVSRWGHNMLGPEGHNWYLHGIKGVVPVGLLFPEFRRSAFFVRTAVSIFEEHLRAHYRPDGGARETNLSYQGGSLMNIWEFYLLARRNGVPLSSGFADAALRATHFLLAQVTPDGRFPSFGDSGFTSGALTSLAAVTAAVTGDRRCKWYAEYCRTLRPEKTDERAGELPLSDFWKTGLEGARAYAALRPQAPTLCSVLMPDTGYAAMRESIRPDAAHLAITACERGPIVTSHGHTDIFSLEVHAGGAVFLAEPGCASYGTSPGRDYDQKTEAHTCLTVDGNDQLPIVNEWRWNGCAAPRIRRWISEPTHDFFHAVHEAYCRLDEHGVIHARKIFFAKAVPGGSPYWVVLDRLLAGRGHDYAAYFHGCVPGRVDGRGVLLESGAGMRLAILPPANAAFAAESVRSAGLDAYLSERKLPPERHPCFAFRLHAQNACLAYALVPLAEGAAAPVVEAVPVSVNGADEDAAEACGLRIDFGSHVDWLCVSHKDFDADLVFGPHTAWGHAAFRREQGAAVTARIDHTMDDGITGS